MRMDLKQGYLPFDDSTGAGKVKMPPLRHTKELRSSPSAVVMAPGGYRLRDYFRIGLPVVLIVFLVVMLTLPIFWKIG